MRQMKVNVIGAGLAGSEAAWALAQCGISVDLYEMRPTKKTEAHQTEKFAEMVCSNSFGSLNPNAASWQLKQELSALNAFVLKTAYAHSVPAGSSLAVDREKFAVAVTQQLEGCPNLTIRREEVTQLDPNEITIVATGPLTSAALAQSLAPLLGGASLYFYDAISPIVSTDSLDLSKMFFASRYGKGEPDFLNIPLTKEQYETFVQDLLSGEVLVPHNFEEEKYFESCLPIETIASRGPKTLAFGPMKPVGLEVPGTGKRAYAVIQLRAENRHRSAYNLVGFQTKLKYPEQLRIFRKLPGLEQAEFLRLGSMHRNTYIDSPRVLLPSLQLRHHPNIFIAGQLTGTEGYLESSATGWLAGTNAARWFQKKPLRVPPKETMLGALIHYITDSERVHFQPINSNMGILPPLEVEIKKDKQKRNAVFCERASRVLADWISEASPASPSTYSNLENYTLPPVLSNF